MTGRPPSNWAGNVSFRARRLVSPADADEVAAIVRSAAADGERVNTVGTGHSFSPIADTDGVLVSTAQLTQIGPLDTDAGTVTIGSGVRFADLGPWLHDRGWALHNLPSLPHITVAGAAATATHGSGDRNGTIASAVRALDVVTGGGHQQRFSTRDADFDGTVVALGALGVVTSLEVAVVPRFEVSQRVWTRAPWDVVRERFDVVMAAADSVSLFTDWRGDHVRQIWVKSRRGADPATDLLRGLGAVEAPAPVHPVDGDPMACTEQLGRPGPAHERLPHFRSGFVPSVGAELQSEFFVDRVDAVDAIDALRAIGDRLAPVLLVSEVRSVAADSLWLSGAWRRPTIGLHFTWRLDPAGVAAALSVVEGALAPFDPRPHWGKLTTLADEVVRARFPNFDAFLELRQRLDPAGTFLSDAVARFVSPRR